MCPSNKSHVKSVLILAKMSAGSQTDRQTDRPTGGSCNFNYDSVSYQRQDKQKCGERKKEGGEWGQSLGNKLTKVVDVLVGLRCLGSTLAMIKCVCLI